FGLILILVGKALGWQWVSNRWFRAVHLAMIVGVIIRAFIWEECPLTWWERDLRGGFEPEHFTGWPVGKVLHDLIHPDLPMWVFPVVYVFFGLLVLAAFWVVPVNWKGSNLSPVGLSEQCPTGGRSCPPTPPGPVSAPPSAAGGAGSSAPTSRRRS
ncbi:MAG: DUF2784 family protein, partial [Gemmataceae bacterium]